MQDNGTDDLIREFPSRGYTMVDHPERMGWSLYVRNDKKLTPCNGSTHEAYNSGQLADHDCPTCSNACFGWMLVDAV